MQDQTRIQPVAPGERWISVEEIMAHLGVARDTVYRWIDQKKLPAHRVGKLWKFKILEVDEWVRSGGAGEPRSGSSPADQARARRA
jgi:excisionase family DNA binding protein